MSELEIGGAWCILVGRAEDDATGQMIGLRNRELESLLVVRDLPVDDIAGDTVKLFEARAPESSALLGQASVKELAEPFAMSQPAISKHLKVLERAGLISRDRDGELLASIA